MRMNIVHFSKTPLAGAPYQQYVCLNKYGPDGLYVRLVNNTNRYADGRVFPHDLLFNSPEAVEVIKQADVIHIHNYLLPTLKDIINSKKQKVVATFHSSPRMGNWQELVKFANILCAVNQPMLVREYSQVGFNYLCNLFDIYDYIPKYHKSIGTKIKIVYTNTKGSPRSRGFAAVKTILDKFQKEFKQYVDIQLVEGVPYLDNLEIKRHCDILIDDVTTNPGTFHLTSIEGACFGCVVLTGVGKGYPFTETFIDQLWDRLKHFVQYPTEIKKAGDVNRKWVEEFWNPKDILKDYLRVYGFNDE